MSSDDSPRFMKSTGRSVTAFRGGNISRRTLRLSRVRSETPCSSLRRCADNKHPPAKRVVLLMRAKPYVPRARVKRVSTVCQLRRIVTCRP